MSSMSQEFKAYPIEGELSIDLEKFPKELLDEMLNERRVPPIALHIPAMFLQDGITLEVDRTGSRAKFTFAAFEAVVTKS